MSTLKVYLLSRKDKMELVDQVNMLAQANLVAGFSVNGLPFKSLSEKMSFESGKLKRTYIAFVFEKCGQDSVKPFYRQLHVIETLDDNLDVLVRSINSFCEDHEVESIDIRVEHRSEYSYFWNAFITYRQ